LESAFYKVSERYRGRIGLYIGYDESLAHMLFSGADTILVPSRFEPCGLTQLYGLRYGCVPIVSRTGGLADTVIDANHAALRAGVATGLQFSPLKADILQKTLQRAQRLYSDRSVWETMQRQGMRSDVSWQVSATAYASIYRSLVQTKH
jgi:starch synthase